MGVDAIDHDDRIYSYVLAHTPLLPHSESQIATGRRSRAQFVAWISRKLTLA